MKVLQALREKREESQATIAAAAGVSQVYLSLLERGITRNPKINPLLKVAHVFGEVPATLLLRDVASLTEEERKDLEL